MMVNANKYNNNDDYNYSCINIVSELLGVDPNTLQKVITRSSVMAHGNNYNYIIIYLLSCVQERQYCAQTQLSKLWIVVMQ